MKDKLNPLAVSASLARRFRGLLPVVIDVETSGLNPATDALLEIAAVTLAINDEGKLYYDKTYAYQIRDFLKKDFSQDHHAHNCEVWSIYQVL